MGVPATQDSASEWRKVGAQVSRDGAYLAIQESKAIRIVETNGWHEVRSLPITSGTVGVIAFDPSSKYIAVGSDEGINIWEVIGNRTSTELPVRYATGILFAPDGKYIVTANWNFSDPSDRSVGIWDGNDHRQLGRLELLEVERARNVAVWPTQLALSKDSWYLALENQGVLRIWDMLTQREVERWISHPATQLSFSPDGEYLLSGHGTTASVRRWGPAAIIAEACNQLDRNLDTEAEWRQYLGDEPYRKTCPNNQ
jgi:WD40 repeat protein